MTSTGTTTFGDTPLADLTAYALGRLGIRRSQITQDHLIDARMAANFVLSSWSNDQPNLWKVELRSQVLTAGDATYTLGSDVLTVLDAYISYVDNASNTIDRIIFSVSRSEYAAYPVKAVQQPPTVYWFNRVIPPVINLYPTPDDTQTYTLNYYAVIQDDDAAIATGATLDIPYRFIKAFVDGLSAELAINYAPDRATALAALAQQSLNKAQQQDVEDVALYIVPGISSYFR